MSKVDRSTHNSRFARKCRKCGRYHHGTCVYVLTLAWMKAQKKPLPVRGDPDRDGRDTRGLASAIGMVEVL